MEVLRIDDSAPAVDFRIVADPPDRVGGPIDTDRASSSEKGEQYRAFFQRLLDTLRVKHHFTNARAAQPQNWYSFTAGIPGLSFGANFARGGKVRTELYIDRGMDCGDENTEILEALQSDAEAISAELGAEVSWEDLPTRRACRLAIYRDGSIDDDDTALSEHHNWIVESLLRLKSSLAPRLAGIVVTD